MLQLRPPALPFWRRDIAIDLGTANTLLFDKEGSVLLEEPSVLVSEERNGDSTMRAVGNEAKRMIGRTPLRCVLSVPCKEVSSQTSTPPKAC